SLPGPRSRMSPVAVAPIASAEQKTARGVVMPLTPADVHNVAFKKPSIGKRGYDEDEVDAFFDVVEAVLTRLIEENSDLSARLTEFEAGGTPAPKVFAPTPAVAPAPAPSGAAAPSEAA